MAAYRVRDTPARWRALDPAARRSLIRHLARQLVIIIAVYVVIALVEQSWWKPAAWMAVIAVVTAAVGRVRAALSARASDRER